MGRWWRASEGIRFVGLVLFAGAVWLCFLLYTASC
jgi:hypothetical protein